MIERVLVTIVETETKRTVGQWVLPLSAVPVAVGVEIPASSNAAEAFLCPYTMVVQQFTTLGEEVSACTTSGESRA